MAQIQVQHQAPVTGPNAAAVNDGGGAQQQLVSTSLYVGDLDQNVTDSQLYDLFNQVGQVVSVRVCRDLSTRRSLGYGYVNYSNPQDAARALEVLNFTPLNSKSIRICYSLRDPTIRKSGTGTFLLRIWIRELTTRHCMIHSLLLATYFRARLPLTHQGIPRAMVLFNLTRKKLLRVP